MGTVTKKPFDLRLKPREEEKKFEQHVHRIMKMNYIQSINNRQSISKKDTRVSRGSVTLEEERNVQTELDHKAGRPS